MVLQKTVLTAQWTYRISIKEIIELTNDSSNAAVNIPEPGIELWDSKWISIWYGRDKEWSWLNVKYFTTLLPRGIQKSLTFGRRVLVRNLNLEPPGYEPGIHPLNL